MFLWCHVRLVNPAKIHLERITREDKELVNYLNFDRAEFPVREKDFSKIETKNSINVNVFCNENKLVFQSKFQIKHLKIQWICYF